MVKQKIKKEDKKEPKKEEKNLVKKVLTSYKEIPNKKPYVEFFTALLSIPVLLTVVMLNLNTLNSNKNPKPSVTPAASGNIFVLPTGEKEITKPEATTKPETVVVTKEACKKQIGPISIENPKEGEIVSDNPIAINVSYNNDEYCTVVWSYRINGGKWSDYDNKSIALYNLPQGNVKVELRVKSLSTSEEKTLTRNFVYRGENTSGVTPTVAAN